VTVDGGVREDFIDFPTGWAIQKAGLITHTDNRCSAVQSPAFLCDCEGLPEAWKRQVQEQRNRREATMIESEDGTVTGSIDVSKLDEIDAKTDEAKAQLDALKADVQRGQGQATKDAEAKAEQERAQSAEGQRESQKESTVDSVPVGDQKSSDQGGDKTAAKKSASSGKDS
jgi:hypothetical protein